MINLIELAQRALALYREADDVVGQITTSVASTKQALSTTDQDQLNSLLAEAQERRRKASENLDQALAALNQG